MDCACIRYTDLPHTSNLFADFTYHPDRVRPFYTHIPSEDGVFEAIAGEIRFPADRRAALVAALRQQNGDSPALDLLSREGTAAILTGQQVGLFSGPAYTIYKALTAIKLARSLADRGIQAVPVFWLATEDHDFAEVNHCWVFDAEHNPIKLEKPHSPASSQPVGQFVLTTPPVEGLRRALRGWPFGDEIAALVEETYQPGRTMGEAFRLLLKRLLPGYGLLHVDPMAPAMRELAAPAIRSALAAAPDLTAAMLARNKALQAAGYHAQVHVEDQTSFVFLLENGRRYTLRRYGQDYLQNGRRFSTAELMDRAAQLSPNALLRPVVQDSMLPTLAYVGGPAELAYLAQSQVIYQSILGRMPAAIHRAGFTIVDRLAAKLMARYGLALPDFMHGSEAVHDRIAARLIPPALAGSLTHTRSDVEQAIDRLARDLAGFDASLAAALGTSRRKVLYQLGKMERKVGRETMARDARVARHAAHLSNLIYPQHHLQERLYSILPLLAKHGPSLVDDLYDCLNLGCPDHQLGVAG
ncbi:MAG TPA: bacillithiol biosynthesis cysteine-adding enzyme BshC [Bryobacteraceae bacterium]|nr:bacillithiol biosynthesis cysteine-adding enzyme BshC [Bryobacteraceae bacterium]